CCACPATTKACPTWCWRRWLAARRWWPRGWAAFPRWCLHTPAGSWSWATAPRSPTRWRKRRRRPGTTPPSRSTRAASAGTATSTSWMRSCGRRHATRPWLRCCGEDPAHATASAWPAARTPGAGARPARAGRALPQLRRRPASGAHAQAAGPAGPARRAGELLPGRPAHRAAPRAGRTHRGGGPHPGQSLVQPPAVPPARPARAAGRGGAHRPPAGGLRPFRPAPLLATARRGRNPAYWSYDSLDYQPQPPDELAARLLQRPPADGDVLLMHDDSDCAAQILAHLLPAWRTTGRSLRALPAVAA